MRLAFLPRFPEHGNLRSRGALQQGPEQTLEQKRMPQFLPGVMAKRLGAPDAEAIRQIRQSGAVQRPDDVLKQPVSGVLDGIVSIEPNYGM